MVVEAGTDRHLCWFALSLAACASGHGAGSLVTVRNSANLRVVENDVARLRATCQVDATPTVRIGVAEGDEAYELYRVFGATRLRDGRIVLVNQGTQEIRFYGRDGRFLQRAGRAGQGPGEFGRRTWISGDGFTMLTAVRELSDGRVLVADSREKRVVFLSATGRLLTDIGRVGQGPGEFSNPTSLMPLRADTTIATDLMLRRYLVIAPDGEIVRTAVFPAGATWAMGRMAIGREEIFAQDGMPSEQAPWTTVARLSLRPGTARPVLRVGRVPPVQVNTPRGVVGTELRFAPNDAWAVTAAGRIAVVRAADYRVEWFDRDGRLLAAGPPTPYDPVPVAAEERRGPFGSALPEPPVKPAFDASHLYMDPEGLLWVGRTERHGTPLRRFDLFGPDGVRLRTVTLPAGRTLLGFGARSVYLIFTDDDDVQWLERYQQ